MNNARQLYIELLKATVRNTPYPIAPAPPTEAELASAKEIIANLAAKYGDRAPKIEPITVCRVIQASRPVAHTLADRAQVDNVHDLIERILEAKVPGDFIEAGVYRGGITILMRGILKAHEVTDRRVFAADSFMGLPVPTKVEDAIAHEVLRFADHFRVSADEVRATFQRYGLLDDQVVLLEGWFRDTLPNAPIEKLALMRLDGDYYESTLEAITALYPKLSVGGFIIVDDYGMPVGCKQAIDEYRERHGIRTPMLPVVARGLPTSSGAPTVYWQKQ